MYVDHASCSSCGARFQPEAIGPGGRCPSCGTTLGIKDLFGVADHLVEEGGENVSFNDLVSGQPSAPQRRAAPQQARAAQPSASEEQGISDIMAKLAAIRRERGG